MNDIQHLIDRYLADGLPADELARLSRAVHRDDAPEEWLVVRDMIDTLTEGEDDYDLLMAAGHASSAHAFGAFGQEESVPLSFPESGDEEAVSPAVVSLPVASASSASRPEEWRGSGLRMTPKRWIAIAASVLLIVAIGATLYFRRPAEPQIADNDKTTLPSPTPTETPAPAPADDAALLAAASPGVAPAPGASSAPVASTAPAAASAPASSSTTSGTRPAATANPVPTGQGPASRLRKTGTTPRHAEAALTAQAEPASQPQPAALAADVPERRIYSCNLLDQISDAPDAPATPVDGN